jgi:hypothetical protein
VGHLRHGRDAIPAAAAAAVAAAPLSLILALLFVLLPLFPPLFVLVLVARAERQLARRGAACGGMEAGGRSVCVGRRAKCAVRQREHLTHGSRPVVQLVVRAVILVAVVLVLIVLRGEN